MRDKCFGEGSITSGADVGQVDCKGRGRYVTLVLRGEGRVINLQERSLAQPQYQPKPEPKPDLSPDSGSNSDPTLTLTF